MYIKLKQKKQNNNKTIIVNMIISTFSAKNVRVV